MVFALKDLQDRDDPCSEQRRIAHSRFDFKKEPIMAETIKEKLEETGHRAAEKATEFSNAVGEKAEKAADWVKEKAHQAGNKAEELGEKAQHKYQETVGKKSDDSCCSNDTCEP
jgi:hypothetical protein